MVLAMRSRLISFSLSICLFCSLSLLTFLYFFCPFLPLFLFSFLHFVISLSISPLDYLSFHHGGGILSANIHALIGTAFSLNL